MYLVVWHQHRRQPKKGREAFALLFATHLCPRIHHHRKQETSGVVRGWRRSWGMNGSVRREEEISIFHQGLKRRCWTSPRKQLVTGRIGKGKIRKYPLGNRSKISEGRVYRKFSAPKNQINLFTPFRIRVHWSSSQSTVPSQRLFRCASHRTPLPWLCWRGRPAYPSPLRMSPVQKELQFGCVVSFPSHTVGGSGRTVGFEARKKVYLMRNIFGEKCSVWICECACKKLGDRWSV